MIRAGTALLVGALFARAALAQQDQTAGTTVNTATIVNAPAAEAPPTPILPSQPAYEDITRVAPIVAAAVPTMKPELLQRPPRAEGRTGHVKGASPQSVVRPPVRLDTRPAAAAPPDQAADTTAASAWPVATSLKSTLRTWAQRQGWPAPRFLTPADWAVDVPGSIPGSIDDALKALVLGFGKSPSRPRIEVSSNHVMLVSEIGAQ